jgi:hypothetical protein
MIHYPDSGHVSAGEHGIVMKRLISNLKFLGLLNE